MALAQHTTQLPKLIAETLYGWLFAVQCEAEVLGISEVLGNEDYQFDPVRHCIVSALTGAMVTSMTSNLMSTIITPGSSLIPAHLI